MRERPAIALSVVRQAPASPRRHRVRRQFAADVVGLHAGGGQVGERGGGTSGQGRCGVRVLGKLISLAAAALLFPCGAFGGTSLPDSAPATGATAAPCSVETIVGALDALPLWCTIGADGQDARDQIMAAFQRVACCSTEEIRAAVASINAGLKKKDDELVAIGLRRAVARKEGRPAPDDGAALARLRAESVFERSLNLHLLATVLFDLPQGLRQRDIPGFAPWQHSYGPSEDESALWPFEVNAEGQVRLADALLFFVGRRAEALAAFDYFAARYPRRANLCRAR